MKEIKFRAWDTLSKEMITNILKLKDQDHNNFGNVLRDFTKKVMQYTGMKDMNGKEIYEGDIVRHQQKEGGIFPPAEPKNCIIKYKNCHFGAYVINSKYPEKEVYMHSEKLEVIGNIYENYELLE